MPSAAAETTYFCPAARTSAVLGLPVVVFDDVARFDPSAASLRGTVVSVLCRVLLVFQVPFDSEIAIE